MLDGYERASKEILPAVRLLIAKELKEKYNMKEVEIASRLNIAQAAVSKYLSGKYSAKIEKIMAQIDTKRFEKYMPGIVNGDHGSVNKCICGVCKTMNDFGCKFSYAEKV